VIDDQALSPERSRQAAIAVAGPREREPLEGIAQLHLLRLGRSFHGVPVKRGACHAQRRAPLRFLSNHFGRLRLHVFVE